jgi:hypothetical protein
LARFLEHLDRWADLESPDQDTRLLVAAWIVGRADQPYEGVRREAGFPNLWFGRIPGTLDHHGSMVTCSYFVFESVRVIRCNSIGRLGLPL